MMSVDTTNIVRLLTRDNEAQILKAYGLFKKDLFISDTVLLETAWVLKYTHEF